MKKIALILGLSIVCLGAQAAEDWHTVTTITNPQDKTQQVVVSVDKNSIKDVKGAKGIRQAMTMWDFSYPRDNAGDASFPTFKSYRDITQYNCSDKEIKQGGDVIPPKSARLASEILYAGNNGTGDKRDHTDALKNSKFAAPAPNTLGEKLMSDFICADALSVK